MTVQQLEFLALALSIFLLNLNCITTIIRYKKEINIIKESTSKEIKNLQNDVHDCKTIIEELCNQNRQQKLEIEKLKFKLRNKKNI